jgi:hypothetical protein
MLDIGSSLSRYSPFSMYLTSQFRNSIVSLPFFSQGWDMIGGIAQASVSILPVMMTLILSICNR